MRSDEEEEWRTVARVALANVQEADRVFRATRLHADVVEIIADFGRCGPLVDLGPSELLQYARHVSLGQPFP
ncbi:hypothetical protein HER21_43780, partial [Pseudomonas sp. BGM005]|nr:hypothetical protein [Pseudomonas sp. BG5]